METIDCTPTWAGLFPALLHLAAGNGIKGEGRKTATEELQRMAVVADQYNEVRKELKALLAYHAFIYNENKCNGDKEKAARWQAIQTAEWACVIAGVSEAECIAIREGKGLSGIRNLNKIASKVNYKQDYQWQL